VHSVKSRVAFAFVFFAAVASADAPPDQYEPFSPQAQDIQDHYTRLDWQRIVGSSMVLEKDAVSLCQSPQRLPTYRELLTIVDEDPHPEWDPSLGATTPRYIDPNAFPGTPSGPFWSMSPGHNPGTFKVVDYLTGESNESSGNNLGWVRCVTDLVP
jgi:hypothetical protein